MSKDLNVNLRIDADVKQAKAQIQDLQNTLKQVAAASSLSPNTFDAKKIKEGVQAAKELQTHLRAATDVNTGKLNLSAFSASLKTSGKSLAQYKTQLEALGPAGEDAFLKVSRSIATANAPLRKTNQYLTEFATTLKNTARWQISSSILHGFMGSVQSAYRYAKDLNESLTDIRIVTGQNADQMAEFAEKANKAAKALSATTNQYTKASLIYYQQGLDDQEVQDRADITIKMAHASGQSAEIVSDQLTAVWNNFAKGGENLEHYADVMTALGAATASSSDEIAGGLEKFASIADMIGLSYEYAASALATITATTRQSEDVVGTALKTIFARIQGLKLGETLDDGTDLNKYSEALQKVGISIFEQNGELKNMDNILDEMGAKWETLSKDQQVALAQTVAGVRQYNQLVSLMDSWDFMQENVALSLNSDGTLNEQAEIYAESWEGASNRVRAAAEGIYQSLLDDDFFITLTNGFATLLEGVDGFVEGLGGMEGVISIIGGFITQKLAKEAPVALNNIKQNLMQITGQAHQIAGEIQNQNILDLQSESKSAQQSYRDGFGSAAYYAEVESTRMIAEAKRHLIEHEHEYNSVQKAAAEAEIANLEQASEMIVKKAQAYDVLKNKVDTQMDSLYAENQEIYYLFKEVEEQAQKIANVQGFEKIIDSFKQLGASAKNTDIKVEALEQQLLGMGKTISDSSKDAGAKNLYRNLEFEIKKIVKDFKESKKTAQEAKQAMLDAFSGSSTYRNMSREVDNAEKEITELVNKIKEAGVISPKEVDKIVQGMRELQWDTEAIVKRLKNMNETLKNMPVPKSTISQSLTQMASAAMQLNSVLWSMRTFKEVFTNEDSTTIEKVSAALGLLTTALFMHNSVVALSTTLINLETKAGEMSIISKKVQAMAAKVLKVEEIALAVAEERVSEAAAKQAVANAALKVSYIGLLGAIAAVAAVIWLVKEAYDFYKNSTPEAQLERLTQEATEASNQFTEVKSAYEDMMSTIESYDGKTSALKELSKGSDEYKAKLLEANEAALHLIETLDLVQGTDYNIDKSTGQIKLNQGSLLDKQAEKFQQVEYAQANSVLARSKQQRFELDIEKSKWGKEQYGSEVKYVSKTGGDTGVEAKKLTDNEAEGKGIDIVNKIAKAFNEQGNSLFADKAQLMAALGEDANEELVNALMDSDSEIRRLVESTALNTEALIDNTAAIVGNLNQDNEEYNALSDPVKDFVDYEMAKRVEEGNFTEEEKQASQNYANKVVSNEEDFADFLSKSTGKDKDDFKVEKTRTGFKVYEKDENGGYDESDSTTYDNSDIKERASEHHLLTYSSDSIVGQKAASMQSVLDTGYEYVKQDKNEQAKVDSAVSDFYKSGDTSGFNIFSEEVANKLIDQILNSNTDNLSKDQKDSLQKYEYDKKDHNKKVEEFEEQQLNTNAAEAGVSPEVYKAYKEEVQEINEILKNNEEIVDNVTKANIKLEKAFKGMSETYEDNIKVLDEAEKGSVEYLEACENLAGGLNSVFGEDMFDTEFVSENLDTIKKAMAGDLEAMQALIDESQLRISAKFNEIDTKGLDTEITAINDWILSQEFDDMKIGTSLDEVGMTENFQKLLDAGAITAEELDKNLNDISFDPDIQMVPVQIDDSKSDESNSVITYTDPITNEVKTTTVATSALVKSGAGFTYPVINGKKSVKTGSAKSFADAASAANLGKTKKGSGGGGKKSTPAEKVKPTNQTKVYDRYKEIDDVLDDIEENLNDINKLQDRLYGSARIKQMENETKVLLQQKKALEDKKKEAQKYFDIDRNRLIQESKKDYGITWTFDENDNISNYTQEMDKLLREINIAEAKMNSMKTKEEQDDFKKKSIEPIEKKIEGVKELIEQYDNTKELLEDLDNQLQEAIWAWQDKNFEVLEYKLELKLDIEDQDLQYLDYLMNKWSDDFFKLAESAALMYNSKGYDQVEGYGNQLANFREHEQELQKQYKNGDISQAKYIEGLKNVRDGYYENLNALIELDKTMLHYYEDSLAAGAEELADYTDHMEHLTEVFGHYLNLMDILGKSKDYEAMGDFLEGRAETLEDQLKVSKDYYEILVEDKAKIEKELNNALRSGSEEDKKYWKEQWDAIVDAVDEAQDQMLSLTEEWASAMKETIQNNMTKLAEELEKALTGGIGFEFLMDEFDKLNTRQEEYLTKTNQIYETNKLIRQASQKIDETDNKVAKQKMQNFITETKSLQENNQLSEYELEIQQAKYELLLAEIALEEAQNAKSTVRLSRDSEGNFGYVYTADQDAVDDAEQELDDAKNRLYNLSLEGQQEYTEKYLQAQQSMFDELAELQQMFLEGEIATQEEYERRREAIVQHYYGEGGVLWTYSKLYNVAVQTDAAATADYWGKEYGEMTQHTEDWQVAVNDYLEQVEDETEDWADVSEKANRIVEGALKDSKTATKDLTDESGNLSKKIRNDLLPAMEKEYERIIKNTKEYGKERDAILEMIAAYEEYLRLINQEIKDESNKALKDDSENKESKDFAFSSYLNTAKGDSDAAQQDLKDRIEIKGEKDNSKVEATIERIEALTDRQKEYLAKELEKLQKDGYRTSDVHDAISRAEKYDTGGFTGVWGPEGKLAFLHEKELVLNQDDTSNLLKTISFIREIVSMIDSQASFANLGFLSTPGFSNVIDHNFEQTVSIYAEFPSATNHTEIEEAFNNLLNTASQYANRKE